MNMAEVTALSLLIKEVEGWNTDEENEAQNPKMVLIVWLVFHISTDTFICSWYILPGKIKGLFLI